MHHTAHLAKAETALRDARTALTHEIAQYPTPISGCDAQFTHLLSERARVGAALAALADAPFVPTPRTLEPGAGVESR